MNKRKQIRDVRALKSAVREHFRSSVDMPDYSAGDWRVNPQGGGEVVLPVRKFVSQDSQCRKLRFAKDGRLTMDKASTCPIPARKE